jgi:hypothetical protein
MLLHNLLNAERGMDSRTRHRPIKVVGGMCVSIDALLNCSLIFVVITSGSVTVLSAVSI